MNCLQGAIHKSVSYHLPVTALWHHKLCSGCIHSNGLLEAMADSSDSASPVNSSDSDLLESMQRGKEDKNRGFQNLLSCNSHLPYHDLLDKEAEELLEDIKLNLSLAVQKHELWPGALYWTNRLRR